MKFLHKKRPRFFLKKTRSVKKIISKIAKESEKLMPQWIQEIQLERYRKLEEQYELKLQFLLPLLSLDP